MPIVKTFVSPILDLLNSPNNGSTKVRLQMSGYPYAPSSKIKKMAAAIAPQQRALIWVDSYDLWPKKTTPDLNLQYSPTIARSRTILTN